MQFLEYFNRSFPLLVICCALVSLLYPPLFTWFSGPWITYSLGGIILGMGLTLQWSDFNQVLKTPKWVVLGVFCNLQLCRFWLDLGIPL